MSPWLIALELAALFSGGRGPLEHVVPPPSVPSLRASACGECHAAIFDAWRGSRHAQAWSNRLFAVSFKREPMRWCVSCHAPLGSALADEGVSCAACHVRGGRVLGARPASARALRAHPVRVEPALARAEFCGGCHQFNFPSAAPPFHYRDEPMQDTLAEWRGSRAAREGRTCQACHLDGHRFPGGHDRALVGRAVSLAVERRGAHVLLTARADGAAHRVPTGDPFRRLRVELCAEPRCDEPLARPIFARVFRPDGDSWTLDADRTIPVAAAGATAERTVDVPLPAPPPILYWRLIYAYAAPSTEPDLDGDDLEIELSRGHSP
ncbi:MAG TPA: multiheme c-type cytochrome [Polyangia bacterium]|nr:multiheme c-type cytochrome [Polyangia bacterium]